MLGKNLGKLVAALLAVFLVWTPTALLAETFPGYASQGQTFGKGSLPNPADLFGQNADGDFVINPGSGGEIIMTPDDLVQGASQQSVEDYTSLFGRDSAISEETEDAQSVLATEVSWTGEAYRTVMDSSNQDHPDLRNDPIWGSTDQTLGDVFSGEFSECELVTRIQEKTEMMHVPDIQTCEKIVKPDGDDCQIEHVIDIYDNDLDIVFLLDTTGSMSAQIAELRDSIIAFSEILTGRGGVLRVGGAGYGDNAYNNEQWRLPLTEDVGGFKDWVDGLTTPHSDEDVYSAINWAKNFFDWRPSASRVIVIIGNNEAYGDRTAAIQTIADLQAEVYAFHNLSLVYTLGNHVGDSFSAAGLFKITQYLVAVEESWTPSSCIEKAQCIMDDVCEGDVVANVTDESQCAQIGPFWVCPDDPIYNRLQPPPFDASISRIATRLSVRNVTSNFNVGEMGCWTDPYGNEHCEYNDGERIDTCGALRSNPECGYIRSECIDGAQGPSGTCYAFTEVFDCGQDVEAPTATREDGYVCEGGIECMGTSCVETDPMTSVDFARAAAALQAAQFAAQDLSCTENGQCEVFKGQPYYCKKAMGGWQDCCEQPAGTSIQDYMDLMFAANKAASAQKWMGMANPVYGAWKTVTDGVSAAGDAAWSKMTQPFTKAWEGIVGESSEELLSKAPTLAIEETINKLTEQAAQWVMDTFGEAATNALFSAGADATAAGATTASEALATEGASGAIVELGGAVLGPVMWAYMAYQIANILVQIVWACEPDEFELGSKRQLKSCHYLGSYCASEVLGACVEVRDSFCCYESPLSRIINEQIKDQLGLSWGSPESPQCGGIAMATLPNVDWSQVNLDEWIGILSMTGHMPTVDSDKLSAEGLTGEGSYLNVSDNRVDFVERATSKVEGASVPDVNEDLRQQLYGN